MATFNAAAMNGLYKSGAAGVSRLKKTSYRSLHRDEMADIVRILSDVPYPFTYESTKKYEKTVQKRIADLPYNLCASSLSSVLSTEDKDTGKVKRGHLCSLHKAMNNNLIYDIWGWVKHELESGVGPFLYPLLLAGSLTKPQEWKARQLEPVLRMYRSEFTEECATPLGFQAVSSHKWGLQENGCPACMLARMGSDKDVMVAMLASIVGRSPSKRIGRREKIRSKRVAMLKYWLRQHLQGDTLFQEAWDMGNEMQRQHRACRKQSRASQKHASVSSSLRESTLSASTMYDAAPRPETTDFDTIHDARASRRESVIPIDISDPYHPTSAPSRRSIDIPIGIDISPPYQPPHRPRPPSSIYIAPAHSQDAPPNLSVREIGVRSQIGHHRGAPSVHSDAGHLSIASSFGSQDESDCPFNYTSTNPYAGDDGSSLSHLRPMALRAHATRSAAERDVGSPRLPWPRRGSIYAEYGLPSDESRRRNPCEFDDEDGDVEVTPVQERFHCVARDEVSPPGTPLSPYRRGKGEQYDVSPPGTPGKSRWDRRVSGPMGIVEGSQVTRWGDIY
jgi:hypothetical protein